MMMLLLANHLGQALHGWTLSRYKFQTSEQTSRAAIDPSHRHHLFHGHIPYQSTNEK